ncbi:MAG TPA: TonB-dependent receptor [Bacteroidales bacterium]|nr:TonB-dependent receptor [Bacteroidales bacterium]
MKKILSVISFILVVWSLNSQVTGYVYEETEESKKPLFGVNIWWLGTNLGTTSSEGGVFSIEKPPNSDTLIFSFVGYIADTFYVKGDNQKIEIILKNKLFLDEVTVGERSVGTHYSRMEIGSVQTITGDELCKAACCNLSESFETNASVDASYSDAVTGAKQIKLLGLAGKYVQMMTENIPNLYGLSQPYALGYIPGPWMESIQVSKGTSTVINGYDAVTGQINVEYKKPLKSDRLFFNQFFSSAGKSETNIDGAIKLNPNWSTMVFAHAQTDLLQIDHNKDNFLDFPMLNQYNFFNRWDYFNKNWTVRFGVKYIDETRKSGQLGHIYNSPLDAETPYGIYIGSKRVEAFYKTGYVFPEKPFQSVAIVSNLTYHNQDSYYGLTTFDAQQYSAYVNLFWQSAFRGNEDHKYNAGASVKYENLLQYLNDSSLSSLEIVPGAYFQYTGTLFEKLHLIAGIRADYHNEFGLLITPRLNAKFNLTGNLSWRVSAGKGYRKPNILAENSFLLASSREILIANDLKLEEAWNFGSNLTYYISIGKRDMAINAEYYRTEFQNQIIADFETFGQVKFYNLDGRSFSNTYQLEVTYQIIKGLDVTAAYRFSDVRQTIGGVLIESPLTSRYKGLANLSYKTPLEKWQFDFTVQFNGKGRIPSTELLPEELQLAKEFPAYTILNSQVTKYFKKWEMYLGCENMLNFTQHHPIIAANDPFGNNFDSALIWGPVHGRKLYLGLRFSIKQRDSKQ